MSRPLVVEGANISIGELLNHVIVSPSLPISTILSSRLFAKQRVRLAAGCS